MGGCAIESFDGKWIYFCGTKENAGIWRVPSKGGKESLVVDVLVNFINFDLAEDGIYYVNNNSEEGSAIEFFSNETGKTTKIMQFETGGIWGMSVSPDRRYILYTQWELPEADILMVENFR